MPSALLTDLYQLAMLHVYLDRGMHEVAVFELFVRRLPRERRFLVAAGLAQALEYLETLAFAEDELDWLAQTGRFPPEFIDSLRGLEFTGDVFAMPEGTVFFADEPILRVAAPIAQAQLVESRLINIMHAQTLFASKAARIRLTAPDKLLVDFGFRRAHGREAGMYAARASYLAGFDGTATVLAGMRYGIPNFGTMAHSYVQAHDSERQSFLDFGRARPADTTLLIDTYDNETGARRAAEVARQLADEGIAVKAVRIDSGDLIAESIRVREILDEGGCPQVGIFCSGNLDEHRLRDMLGANAPVDGFGVGTNLDVSTDAPALDVVYKLQEYDGRARRKRSPGKATWPGRKQVFRRFDEDGFIREDVLSLEDEAVEGSPLLVKVMEAGRRMSPSPSLDDIRARCARELSTLPEALRAIDPGPSLPVVISNRLRALAAELDATSGDVAD